MLDFASSLYLGLRHSSQALDPWGELTTGKPASLEESALPAWVAARVAALQGCEAGVVSASTLHLSLDVLGDLAGREVLILADENLYPISKWGVERAAARGAELRWYPHGNPFAAMGELARSEENRRVVLVSDAVMANGRPMPLKRYHTWVAGFGGTMVVDNTQALGVYGCTPSAENPFGYGGGGILRHSGIGMPKGIVLISSLAKAFGAPLAVLAGERGFIDSFRATSQTRQHSSPPSTVALLAGAAALRLNGSRGDEIRARLLMNVRRLRRGLKDLGLRGSASSFPVQWIELPTTIDPVGLHRRLRRRGIKLPLLRGRRGVVPRLGVVLRADHSPLEIGMLLDQVARALPPTRVNAPKVSPRLQRAYPAA